MITLPYSNPTTSKSAAHNPGVLKKSVTDRRIITEFIAAQADHGATDQELAEGCPTVHCDSVRGRRGDSFKSGFITKEPGERRLTRSGNYADVWFITQVGLRSVGLPSDSFCVRVAQ